MSELFSEEMMQEIMGENLKSTPRYVSCIRIDGSPILPPLIDDRYRNELTHYRNMAILVEKKARDRQKLKDNRHSVDSGVIINASAVEPSWLTPCILQSKHIKHSVAHSFDSRGKSSCETLCLHQSNSSDDASSKHFICDDDMWRYVSNCADEQIPKAWFDNQAEEFLSNFGAGLNVNSSQSNLPSSNCSQLVKESENKRGNSISDKSARLMDKESETVTKLSVIFAEYHKDLDVNCASRDLDSSTSYRNNNVNEILSSYDCQSVNQRTESNCFFPPRLNSEDDFVNECICDQTLKNISNDAMLHDNKSKLCDTVETFEREHYFIDNGASISRFSADFDCFKNNYNSDFSSERHAMSELTPCLDPETGPNLSLLEISQFKSGVVKQGTLNVNYGNFSEEKPVSQIKNTPENKSMDIKINCSLISSPEFLNSPLKDVHQKQKPEKLYNPMCYGEYNNEISTENNDPEILKDGDTTVDLPKNRVNHNVADMGSENSGDEAYQIPLVEDSTYLENSMASQKHSTLVPFSDSVSVSEIDFLSCSAATAAPDTSEDVSELHNHLSSERDELSPPKLVRQNSYTLITPSPVLLAHAKATEKMSSDDDNSKNPVSKGLPAQFDSQLKINGSSKKGVKYIYAVPCKDSSILDQNEMKSNRKLEGRSHQRTKIASLPGSAASSPVKVNLFHSSLDNLPIVSVRRFQELIDKKSIRKKCIHLSKPNTDGQEVSENRALSNRSSSLDLQKFNETPTGDRLKCRSKSDLHESKSRPSSSLNFSDKKTNKPEDEVKILFREPSLNSTPLDLPQHLKMNDGSTPNSNHSNEMNFHKLSPDCNDENEQTLVCNSLSPSGSSVQQLFLQLQDQHSQLMAQLLERQKKEQEALANTFLNQQRQILQEIQLIPSASSDMQTTSPNSDTGRCGTEKNSPSAQQSNHTFASVSVESHLSNSIEMPQSCGNSDLSRYNNSGDIHCSTSHNEELDVTLHSPLPQKTRLPITEEQKNAVTIINAAARGYLVRRLLKTEHVQEIINTISESVQCALQLQRECPVDITPSDIELHRRLIQQLTAACYSLHDTFFSLSIQEKMNIIANDRDKRRNPSSRPMSARSSLSSATQKYIQRKQQQKKQSERPVPNMRRSWWHSKARVCSAGQYDQSPTCYSKQHIVVSSKQQQQPPCSNRTARRPWR